MLARSTGGFGARSGVVEMGYAEVAAEVVLQVDAKEEIDGRSGTGYERIGVAEGKLDCGRDSHVVALVVPSAAQLAVEMSIEAPLRCKESSRTRAVQLSLSKSLS